MENNKGTRYEDFEAELLKRPGVKAHYEALKPKYNIVSVRLDRTQKTIADFTFYYPHIIDNP